MATSLVSFMPGTIRASSSAPKPEPNRRKPASSNWWSPLFGWSSDPDYIPSSSAKPRDARPIPAAEAETGRLRSKITPGGFTEEKARQLRKKTMESSTFHDVMYHSAIASRLASDLSDWSQK